MSITRFDQAYAARHPSRSRRTIATAQAAAPKTLDVELGARIRTRRKALGLSQTALAEAVGITFQQVQKYERGFNRVSFSRLAEIAHALDFSIAQLIGDLDGGRADPAFRANPSHLRADRADELLAGYRAMPRPLQRVILNLVQTLAVAPDVGLAMKQTAAAAGPAATANDGGWDEG